MAWKSFLLNGFLSMMDMKQHLMMGTEQANCCDDDIFYSGSGRSLDTGLHGHRAAPVYTNPVIRDNAPDPSVIKLSDGSGYVAVVTSDHSSRYSSDPRAFPLYYSRDLIHWQLRSWVFTGESWPGWAQDNMWAPELHNVNGRYILYYVARDMRGQTVIGAAAAASDDPFGPYLDTGRPLISATESVGGAIDPHYFKDPQSGRDYLLWKEDKPLAFQASIIFVRELHPSGIYFKGPAVEILKSSLDNLLEERLVAEAPWMMYQGGYYYLFYSSAWTTEMKYHIRVAVSKSVYGPFHRSHTPVITTDWKTLHQGHNCSFVGPGHGSVVEVDGEWWLFYHAWINGKMNQEPGRLMLMDKIQWRNGWPVVGVPSDSPRPGPRVKQAQTRHLLSNHHFNKFKPTKTLTRHFSSPPSAVNTLPSSSSPPSSPSSTQSTSFIRLKQQQQHTAPQFISSPRMTSTVWRGNSPVFSSASHHFMQP